MSIFKAIKLFRTDVKTEGRKEGYRRAAAEYVKVVEKLNYMME